MCVCVCVCVLLLCVFLCVIFLFCCSHLHLTAWADRPSQEYSGGNKRKLSVAIALLSEPDAIFLDEPTTVGDKIIRFFSCILRHCLSLEYCFVFFMCFVSCFVLCALCFVLCSLCFVFCFVLILLLKWLLEEYFYILCSLCFSNHYVYGWTRNGCKSKEVFMETN